MLICKVCITGSLLYVPKCAFPQWNAFNLTFHFQFDQWTDSYTNDDFYHLLFFNHYLIRLLHLKKFFIGFKNLIILDFYSIYYLFHKYIPYIIYSHVHFLSKYSILKLQVKGFTKTVWYHMHQCLFRCKKKKSMFARTTLCVQIPMNNNVIGLVIVSILWLFLHMPYV